MKGGSVVFKLDEEILLDEMKITADRLVSQWSDAPEGEEKERFWQKRKTAKSTVKEMHRIKNKLSRIQQWLRC